MWNADITRALHSRTSSGPVQYAATSLELYSSTGTTYDVPEPEHDVALHDALSSRTAVATMGSALSVFSVQINSDFFFFHYPVKQTNKQKNKRDFLGVFKHSLCGCCKRYLEIVVVLQNREH